MRVRTEAKRDSIVQASLEVFLTSGFEGASMAEIAERVGGSKATLYSYFKSKEELFVEAMQTAVRGQFVPLLTQLDHEVISLRDTLQKFGEGALKVLCSDVAIETRRAVIAEAGRSDIGRHFHETGPQKGIDQLAAFLQRQMLEGRLKSADPLLAARQFLALLERETVTPRLFGLEKAMSQERIREAVDQALASFFAIHGTPAS